MSTQTYNQVAGTTEGFIELEPKDLCHIDEETAKTLELIVNSVDSANKKHSLFGYLNVNTCTTSGSRLIRENIMRPLCHQQTLKHRLNCIEYLVNRLDNLSAITNCLKGFGQNVDLDSVLPSLVNLVKSRSDTLQMVEKRLDALTTIESLVSKVAALTCALEFIEEPLINMFKIALEDPQYDTILNSVYEVVEAGVQVSRGKRNKMFLIRQGVDSLFDISRSTYTAAIEDIEQYVRELRQEDGLPWKLNYNESRGYFLVLSIDQVPMNTPLSSKYIRVTRTRTIITCTTKDLWQSDVRAKVSYENSMKLANEILSNAISSITHNISPLLKLVDIVSMIDLITSFAKLVVTSNGRLVKPEFTAMETIITKSRHPLLESVLSNSDRRVEANDVTFSAGSRNFMLITGPNMGGKSVFLKQVALIQIMAQIGCYVPAESAHIKLMNRIVARSGTNDDNSSSCSSFMWEMRGIATALQSDRSTPNESVLYVIDEVGRGTSIDDGASYSLAIAEELALRRNCFTAFATHFDQVFYLTALYGNVTAYHFKYEKEERVKEGELNLSHRLEPGLAERNHYGIRLAIACRLPEEIIKTATSGLMLK